MPYTPSQATNGPQSDSDFLSALVATRNNVAQELAQETAAIASGGGARASFNLGNRQVQWNEWRAAMIQQLKDLDDMIQALDPPWEIQVHGWLG